MKLILISLFALSASAATFDTKVMLDKVNEARQKEGKAPICYSSKLMTSAQKHSAHQASINRMTHDGPEPLMSRFTNVGFQAMGVAENVAQTNSFDVPQVMSIWIASEGHKKNIVGDYTHFGAAAVKAGDGKVYWTQQFGKASNEPCSDGSASSPPSTGSPPPGAPSQPPTNNGMGPAPGMGTMPNQNMGAPPNMGMPDMNQMAPGMAPGMDQMNGGMNPMQQGGMGFNPGQQQQQMPPMAPPPNAPGGQQPSGPQNGNGNICIGTSCYSTFTNEHGVGFVPVGGPPQGANPNNGPFVL